MAAPGDAVGPHKILSELGTGGMATLYLARRGETSGFVHPVALKVVHEHLRDDIKLLRMFLAEARVSVRVRHPNVVHVEDLGEHDGQPYLVMEYIDGVTLSDILRGMASRQGLLPIPVAVAIAAQVADGLHAAHEAFDARGRALGIVHRDVSPQNILVSSRGVVKLIDFGIARTVDRTSMTNDSIRGKVPYMSPEQARGRPLDRRTDIYALAIVLWEMLVMKRLFSRATEYETYLAVTDPAVTSPSEVRPDVPPAVAEALMRALSPTPADRQQTAQQLRLDLLAACPEATRLDARNLADVVTDAARDGLARRRALAGDFAERTVVTHLENVELDDDAALVGADDIEDTPEDLDRYSTTALARGDLVTATMCKTRVVILHGHAGELEKATRALREATEMTRGAAPALRGQVDGARGMLCTCRGDYLGRLQAQTRALDLLERGGWVRRAVATAGNLADAYIQFGAYALAEDAALGALARARQFEMAVTTTYVLLNLGFCRYRQGRLTEAETDLDEGLRLALELGRRHAEIGARIYRADLLALSGRMSASRGEAEFAVELSRGEGSTQMETLASIRVAHAALALGDANAGLEAASRAHALLLELGAVAESEADVFLVLNRALEAAGDRPGAREALDEGRRRLLETASKINDSYWKRRFLEDVPENRQLRQR